MKVSSLLAPLFVVAAIGLGVSALSTLTLRAGAAGVGAQVQLLHHQVEIERLRRRIARPSSRGRPVPGEPTLDEPAAPDRSPATSAPRLALRAGSRLLDETADYVIAPEGDRPPERASVGAKGAGR